MKAPLHRPAHPPCVVLAASVPPLELLGQFPSRLVPPGAAAARLHRPCARLAQRTLRCGSLPRGTSRVGTGVF